MDVVQLACVGFATVGVVLVAAAVHRVVQEVRFFSSAIRIEGRVVAIASIGSPGGRLHAPVIAFERPDGKKGQFRANGWTRWHRYKVGDSVRLLYKPGVERNRVSIESWSERLAGGPALALMGVAFIFFAWWMFHIRANAL